MKKNYICTLASVLYALMVCLMLFFNYKVMLWEAACYSLAVIAVQYFAWSLCKFKSDIVYSCSFLPAVLCVVFVILRSYVWLAVSIVLLMLLVWLFDRERFQPRETTRVWAALLIYLVNASFTAALIRQLTVLC